MKRFHRFLLSDRKDKEPLDRYGGSPQWPWVAGIILLFTYGLWKGLP